MDVEEASKADQRSVVRFLTAGGVGGREIQTKTNGKDIVTPY